jgi:hypothetical protein
MSAQPGRPADLAAFAIRFASDVEMAGLVSPAEHRADLESYQETILQTLTDLEAYLNPDRRHFDDPSREAWLRNWAARAGSNVAVAPVRTLFGAVNVVVRLWGLEAVTTLEEGEQWSVGFAGRTRPAEARGVYLPKPEGWPTPLSPELVALFRAAADGLAAAEAHRATITRDAPERPEWDAATRSLCLRGRVALRLTRKAPRLEPIMERFEAEGWPDSIDAASVSTALCGETLRDAVKDLNEKQNPLLVRFARSGTGTGIGWAPVPAEGSSRTIPSSSPSSSPAGDRG